MSERNVVSTGIGLRHVRVALRSSAGVFEVPASTPVGTAYAGRRLQGAIRLNLTPADARRINATGDDAAYHTFVLPPEEVPSGELAATKVDIETLALLSSVKSFGSAPVRKLALATDQLGFEAPCMLWGVRKAVDSEEGSEYFGQEIWQVYHILNAILTIRPPTMEYGNVGELVLNITANYSTVDEMGVTFTQATHGCTRAPFVMGVWKDFPWVDVFKGDGTEDTFTLTQAAADLSTVDPVLVAVNGVLQTSGWSLVDNTIVFSSPPADGANIVVEYSYVP